MSRCYLGPEYRADSMLDFSDARATAFTLPTVSVVGVELKTLLDTLKSEAVTALQAAGYIVYGDVVLHPELSLTPTARGILEGQASYPFEFVWNTVELAVLRQWPDHYITSTRGCYDYLHCIGP